MIKILDNIRGIVTPAANLPMWELLIQESVALAFEGHIIKEIGPPDALKRRYPDAVRIDGENCWAFPGYVDPHTHPVFYKTRELEFEMRSAGKSYEEIAAAGGGIRNSARSFGEASYEELAELAYRRISTFLEYGTTTIEAKSGYALTLEGELRSLRILKKVAKLLPITIVPTFLGAHEVPDEYRDRREVYIELLIKEMIPQIAEEKLAVFCDVFCEKNVFTVEESERILRAGLDHGLRPKLHADELNYTGGAELAAKVGAISADHLLQISDEGISAMKDAAVSPVLLPGTAFYLGKPSYAPARKMIAAGLPVALATDFNPGSCMTQNMHLIQTIAAVQMKMSPAEVIYASTLHSAKAIGVDGEYGSIEVGKKADITLFDIPNYKYLPYHYGINHVRKVIRHGRVLK